MKLNSLFLHFAILLAAVSIVGCNHSRPVVPCDIDTDEVYKPIPPNEESSPNELTFGKKNIPGFIFDTEMTTENSDIYIYFNNLTVLDINPSINQSIFDFIQDQLKEFGFVNDSVSLQKNEFETLIKEGMNFSDAAARILDFQKNCFEAQYDTIASYNSPFNIYFQIYPVYLDEKYVTYRESSYCYTGGAHGMTESNLFTYDLTTGNLMTLEDIVKPESMDEVREEVAAHMAYSYPIYENITTVEQYIDSLNVWLGDSSESDASSHDNRITLKNYPLPTPALTDEGLAFVYQMYVLTPGSDGCPIIVIPYRDIRGCLFDYIGK